MIELQFPVPPNMRSQINDFLSVFVTNHTNIPGKLTCQFISDFGVKFFDPRWPNKVAGQVLWHAPGRQRNDFKYTIKANGIQNSKYAYYNPDYHSQATKNFKKAVNIALKHIKTFSWKELADETKHEAVCAQMDWINEVARDSYNAFDLSVPAIFTEIKHLASMGVKFKTAEFSDAEKLIPKYEEWLERKQINDQEMICYFLVNDKYVHYEDTTESEGKPIEELSELHQQRISVLKLTDANLYIPNIGIRSREDIFWVYS
jgi:hypothetical protein